MTMAASVRTAFYKMHLKCPVCMEMFSDPRALPCLHTFCRQCLHKYILSATSSKSSDGFECPVCRAFTSSPVHGLYPYSWAENYPPNYTVKGLVEDVAKQKGGLTEEMGSKIKIPLNLDYLNISGSKGQDVFSSHSEKKAEFYCEDHNTYFCNICTLAQQHKKCENVGLRRGNMVDSGDGQDVKDPNMSKHRSLSRLGRSSSMDEEEHSDNQRINPNTLAKEFAGARVINPDKTSSSKSNATVGTEHIHQKMTLRRLYGENKERRRSFESISTSQINYGDEMPAPVCAGTRSRLTKSKSVDGEEHGLTDDLREFLSIHLPAQVQKAGNPVGNLNDIKEEDEEMKHVEMLQSVPKHHDKIYVRLQSDARCCLITGITTMPDERVMVADENNKNVKMFDCRGLYLNHITFSSEPFDIDHVEGDEAVVSFPSEKCIRVLRIDEMITVTRTIPFEKKCLGVVYRNHKFLVAMENEIRVLNYHGAAILSRYHRDPSKRKLFSSGKCIFTEASYLAVDDRFIHVSDDVKRCVVTLNKKGEVISTFREGECVKMQGLSTGPAGKVFVCQWPNTLYLLTISEHGCHIRSVLDLDNIQAVHYDSVTKKLWISQATNNFINMYSFKQNYFT